MARKSDEKDESNSMIGSACSSRRFLNNVGSTAMVDVDVTVSVTCKIFLEKMVVGMRSLRNQMDMTVDSVCVTVDTKLDVMTVVVKRGAELSSFGRSKLFKLNIGAAGSCCKSCPSFETNGWA